MKKLILSILIASTSLISIPSLATSGACSSHGGVSCSTGPDMDESVICTDGWKDSSINYWQAEECSNYLCPEQQVLKDALIKKANENGALSIGTSSLCEELGITGYSALESCLNLQSQQNNQTQDSINTLVNSYRHMCYTNSTTTLVDQDAPPNQSTPFFSDIEGYIYEDSIKKAHLTKIVEGYSDGTFKPKANINRAEFTKIIVSALYANEVANYPTTSCFPDVIGNTWYTSYVCLAKEKKIISGYPDGFFRPENNVNMVESLKIGFESYFPGKFDSLKEDPWWLKYTKLANSYNAMLSTWTSPDQFITRGEMTELITRLNKIIF